MKKSRAEWRRRQDVRDLLPLCREERITAGHCIFLVFIVVLLIAAVVYWGPEIDALFD
jgi:hypothetical protein